MTESLDCTTSDILFQFRQIIRHHIGLIVPESEQSTLSHILHERVNYLRMDSQQTYLTFLESNLPESEQEWALLANRLRVGESYFFRDSGQMSLLETVILPELLQRNENKRTLRILSAGCSTGEEAYSLAILLDQIIPSWDDWNIKILGVDIDEQSLNTAYNGLYSKWSFRRVPKAIKSEYFEKQGSNWRINSNIRSKVEFRCVNLIKHDFLDNNDFAEMDLIICRNVFIYFHQDTIEKLINKFTHILNTDGYLLTGHGELYGIKHSLLAIRTFATSVVYQKLYMEESQIPTEISATKSVQPISHYKKKSPRVHAVSNNIVNKKFIKPHPTIIAKPLSSEINKQPAIDIVVELQNMFRASQYTQMLKVDINLLEQSSQALKGWQLLAQACANLGQYEQAEGCCAKLLEIDAFYAPAYFIMAQITGEEPQKKEFLKKSLYLDHNFVAPMLELAEIAVKENKVEKAKKLRKVAYRILKTLPEDATVDMLSDWTVQDLLGQVSKLL